MVSTQNVVMAYRLLLNREPEDLKMVKRFAKTIPDLAALREMFMASNEFISSQVPKLPSNLDEAGPLQIDVNVSATVLAKMFARIEATWRDLGNTEPHWSVLSSDAFRQESFQQHSAQFYESGRTELNRLGAWLERNGFSDFGSAHSCCEYGCGTGRVTPWLASRFAKITACDISAPHLQLTREHLQELGITNVKTQHIASPEGLKSLKPVDFVFSVIVLQHNPPPVIAFILEKLLNSLKPGGLAYFQIPTYATEYKFIAKTYLKQPPSGEIEVHVLMQHHVYEIAEKAGCRVVEVQADGCLGLPLWISSTFLLQKKAAKGKAAPSYRASTRRH